MPAKLVLAFALCLLATAPVASATMTVYGPGPLTIWGTATSCFVAVTPIGIFGPTPALVLQNFAGVPQTAAFVAIQLTSGSVTCSWNGSVYVVTSTAAVGTAVAGP